MPDRQPAPAQKVAKNHLDYRPRPTRLGLRNRPELWARCPDGPEQELREAGGETDTESQIRSSGDRFADLRSNASSVGRMRRSDRIAWRMMKGGSRGTAAELGIPGRLR